MQIIQKEITRHDFEKACKLNNLEYFTLEQVDAWVKDNNSLIEKSQTEELDDIEKSLVDEFTVTAPNLNLVSVLNDDLTKSVMYVRPSQIDWDKDENGELMKAKSGTYSDTPENRKLGRVGQKYGGSKKDESTTDKHEKYLNGLLKRHDEAKDKNEHINSLDADTKAYLKNVLEKRSQNKGEEKKEEGDIEGAKKAIKILAGEGGIGEFKEDSGIVRTYSKKFNISPEKTISILKEHGGSVKKEDK